MSSGTVGAGAIGEVVGDRRRGDHEGRYLGRDATAVEATGIRPVLRLVPPLAREGGVARGGGRLGRAPRDDAALRSDRGCERLSGSTMGDTRKMSPTRASSLKGYGAADRPERVDQRAGVPARPVRLTRRGRIVLGALLVAAAVALIALLAPPTQASPPGGAARTVVVHPGDTLWSIAQRALPNESINESMLRIERLNHMSDATVYVGQQLTLPGR
jgi:LysM repeat protein